MLQSKNLPSLDRSISETWISKQGNACIWTMKLFYPRKRLCLKTSQVLTEAFRLDKSVVVQHDSQLTSQVAGPTQLRGHYLQPTVNCQPWSLVSVGGLIDQACKSKQQKTQERTTTTTSTSRHRRRRRRHGNSGAMWRQGRKGGIMTDRDNGAFRKLKEQSFFFRKRFLWNKQTLQKKETLLK